MLLQADSSEGLAMNFANFILDPARKLSMNQIMDIANQIKPATVRESFVKFWSTLTERLLSSNVPMEIMKFLWKFCLVNDELYSSFFPITVAIMFKKLPFVNWQIQEGSVGNTEYNLWLRFLTVEYVPFITKIKTEGQVNVHQMILLFLVTNYLCRHATGFRIQKEPTVEAMERTLMDVIFKQFPQFVYPFTSIIVNPLVELFELVTPHPVFQSLPINELFHFMHVKFPGVAIFPSSVDAPAVVMTNDQIQSWRVVAICATTLDSSLHPSLVARDIFIDMIFTDKAQIESVQDLNTGNTYLTVTGPKESHSFELHNQMFLTAFNYLNVIESTSPLSQIVIRCLLLQDMVLPPHIPLCCAQSNFQSPARIITILKSSSRKQYNFFNHMIRDALVLLGNFEGVYQEKHDQLTNSITSLFKSILVENIIDPRVFTRSISTESWNLLRYQFDKNIKLNKPSLLSILISFACNEETLFLIGSRSMIDELNFFLLVVFGAKYLHSLSQSLNQVDMSIIESSITTLFGNLRNDNYFHVIEPHYTIYLQHLPLLKIPNGSLLNAVKERRNGLDSLLILNRFDLAKILRIYICGSVKSLVYSPKQSFVNQKKQEFINFESLLTVYTKNYTPLSHHHPPQLSSISSFLNNFKTDTKIFQSIQTHYPHHLDSPLFVDGFIIFWLDSSIEEEQNAMISYLTETWTELRKNVFPSIFFDESLMLFILMIVSPIENVNSNRMIMFDEVLFEFLKRNVVLIKDVLTLLLNIVVETDAPYNETKRPFNTILRAFSKRNSADFQLLLLKYITGFQLKQNVTDGYKGKSVYDLLISCIHSCETRTKNEYFIFALEKIDLEIKNNENVRVYLTFMDTLLTRETQIVKTLCLKDYFLPLFMFKPYSADSTSVFTKRMFIEKSLNFHIAEYFQQSVSKYDCFIEIFDYCFENVDLENSDCIPNQDTGLELVEGVLFIEGILEILNKSAFNINVSWLPRLIQSIQNASSPSHSLGYHYLNYLITQKCFLFEFNGQNAPATDILLYISSASPKIPSVSSDLLTNEDAVDSGKIVLLTLIFNELIKHLDTPGGMPVVFDSVLVKYYRFAPVIQQKVEHLVQYYVSRIRLNLTQLKAFLSYFFSTISKSTSSAHYYRLVFLVLHSITSMKDSSVTDQYRKSLNDLQPFVVFRDELESSLKLVAASCADVTDDKRIQNYIIQMSEIFRDLTRVVRNLEAGRTDLLLLHIINSSNSILESFLVFTIYMADLPAKKQSPVDICLSFLADFVFLCSKRESINQMDRFKIGNVFLNHVPSMSSCLLSKKVSVRKVLGFFKALLDFLEFPVLEKSFVDSIGAILINNLDGKIVDFECHGKILVYILEKNVQNGSNTSSSLYAKFKSHFMSKRNTSGEKETVGYFLSSQLGRLDMLTAADGMLIAR